MGDLCRVFGLEEAYRQRQAHLGMEEDRPDYAYCRRQTLLCPSYAYISSESGIFGKAPNPTLNELVPYRTVQHLFRKKGLVKII